MGVFLRLTLTSIFIGFAINLYLNPTYYKEYTDLRYKQLYTNYFRESPIAKIIPGNLIASCGSLTINIIVGVLATTGLCALFGFSCFFKFLAMIFVLCTAVLHIPFFMSSEEPIGEIRKLMFIVALACGILVYKESSCHHSHEPEIEKQEVKKE